MQNNSIKLKLDLPHYTAVPLSYKSEESSRETIMPVFTVALLTIAKLRNLYRSLSTNKWIKKFGIQQMSFTENKLNRSSCYEK
jgi:hypothetical protein